MSTQPTQSSSASSVVSSVWTPRAQQCAAIFVLHDHGNTEERCAKICDPHSGSNYCPEHAARELLRCRYHGSDGIRCQKRCDGTEGVHDKAGNYSVRCVNHKGKRSRALKRPPTPGDKLLAFIRDHWGDHERFLALAFDEDDDVELMPGVEVPDDATSGDEIKFSLEDFLVHQKRVIKGLSEAQITFLNHLADLVTSGELRMMDCEVMSPRGASGFWLTAEGNPVMFKYR